MNPAGGPAGDRWLAPLAIRWAPGHYASNAARAVRI